MFIIMLAGLFALMGAWSLYFQKHWNQGISVTLDFDRTSAYAGDDVLMTEVITNRKRLPVPVLEVGFHTKRELVFRDTENTNVSDYIYKRDVFSVLGRQRITRTLTVHCTKRGYYRVEEADLTAFSLLYDRRYAKQLDTDAAIYVYAAPTAVSDVMTVCERMLGTLQCSKRLYEDPFAFRGIREYTVDDPMKTINWKASAKGGGLMVNTFDSVMTRRVMLYLDVEDSGILKQERLIEESISMAASLVRKLLRQGIELGYASNARYPQTGQGVRFAPQDSRGMLVQLERSLAVYHVQDGAGVYEDCFEETDAQDAVLIFISKNVSEERRAHIESFVGKERYGIWVCPCYRGEKQELATSSHLRMLAREVDRV